MKNELEIVKQLKEEEKLGKLHIKVQSTHENLETQDESPKDISSEAVSFAKDTLKKNTVRDTSIYKERKGAFWKSEEIYRKIFELSPETIVVIDKKGTILEINGRVYDQLGYKPEEIVGKKILKLPFLSKESKAKITKNFFLRILGKEILPYEVEFIAKSGEKRVGRIHGISIKDDNGKVVGDLVIASDVTENKKAEDALRESEERFKDLFQNANDLIQSVDINGRFVYVNKSWLETLGYTEDELEGLTLRDILRKDQIPHCMEVFKKVCNGGSFDRAETIFVSKDGHEIYVEGNVNAKFKGGEFIATRGIFRDITRRRKTEEELKKSKRRIELQNIKLRKLDELKTDFLNVTSHELRTPVTPIKGYLQMLLKQKIGSITEEQEKVLKIIQRNTDRLDHLIQDLLDISRLESGTMKFIPEQADINRLIGEIAETMRSSADLKNIKINVDLEEKIPDLIIDRDRVKQVIMNLINNAIKFSPDGSVVNIRAKKEEDEILFEVQDSGRGIPKNEQTKIFDTFYQVDSGMDRKFGGVGLGLSISRGIVLAHGGRIWAESTVGKGSTFRFTFPIEPTLDIEGEFREVAMFGLENT